MPVEQQKPLGVTVPAEQLRSSGRSVTVPNNQHLALERRVKVPEDQRLALVRAHGDFAMAHATLDPALNALQVAGLGYQAYVRSGGRVIGFFKPVCAPDDCKALLKAFFADPRASGIVQVDAATARICRGMSLMTHRMGVETSIEIDRFTLDGAPMRMVREACNRGRRLGYEIGEIGAGIPDDAATWMKLKEISGEWMATRTVKTREVGVMMRHSVFALEDGCRKFALVDSVGEVKGYQVYDPIYRHGEMAGYTLSFARFARDRLKGRHYFMTARVLERLRDEGCRRIELGLSPLYRVEEQDPLNSSAVVQRMMHLLFQHGGRLYGFKGLALHKRKYRGREEPTYLVTRGRLPLGLLTRLVRITGLIGWRRPD